MAHTIGPHGQLEQLSRAGLMTPAAATVAEGLRQDGYATAAFGNWHLIPEHEPSPPGKMRSGYAYFRQDMSTIFIRR